MGRDVTEEELLEKGKEHAKRQKLLSVGDSYRCPHCHSSLVDRHPACSGNCDIYGEPEK